MGHSSSIGLGIALNKPHTKVWCIDGDGAALMHMGSMALIGAQSPENYIHVLINNGAHESVGGQPTIANKINFCKIAEGCGYNEVYHIKTKKSLEKTFEQIHKKKGPIFVEIKSSIGSRSNLGRPTTGPLENKKMFMKNLEKKIK